MTVCELCGAEYGEENSCLRCSPTEYHDTPASSADACTAPTPRPIVAGRYQVEDVLGKGGFGIVYRAVDTRLSRPVALKLLARSRLQAGSPDLERFRRESLILASLDHPNIVPVFDAGVDDERAFIVMKLVSGQSLSHRLRGGPLGERDALLVVRQIVAALEHAHARGVLHRDIKPSNVLEDAAGGIFLADFGVSTAGFLPRFTQQGAVVGSLHYMSPEALAGNFTAASDIYSLGALLYECAFGETLFDAPSAPTLIHKICYDEPPLLASPPEHVSPELVALMRDLTRRDPGSRISSADEVLRRVDGLLGASSLPVASVEGHLATASSATAERDIACLSDELDHLEEQARLIVRLCSGRTADVDQILGSASQFLTDCSTLLQLLAAHKDDPGENASLPALAHSLSHLAKEVERSLLQVDNASIGAFLGHIHRALAMPVRKLLEQIEQSSREPAAGDFFEFDATEPDGPESAPEHWLGMIGSADELERHDALVAIVGASQSSLLLSLSALGDEARHAAVDALWRGMHVVLMEGRSRARAVLEYGIANSGDAERASLWRLLYSMFRKSAFGYWDPAVVGASIAQLPPEDRRVLGRCLLIHPSPGYRSVAFEHVEPSDYWNVISSQSTPLSWLLALWRHLAPRVSPDYLKVFFVCARDRLVRPLDATQVVPAVDLLKEFFEVNCFHEDVFFRMLMELDERVRASCRKNKLLVDFDAEYLERAKAFMGGGVRREREIEEWSAVPLPIQRRLARGGHFLRHFACHPLDQIAMECLPHILKYETGRPFAELSAINARLIGELAKEKRLFQNDDARFALVRNPKTPAYAVMKYIGFLRRDSMQKLADAKDGNLLAREYARKMVGKKG